ncbi:MAG: efflux RND transporter periplasmic adaptor subunit [Gemmataceae bacterium]|nr:efflux RND transporter periplasmic adaptor subunit [Gemmataceae bacterium]
MNVTNAPAVCSSPEAIPDPSTRLVAELARLLQTSPTPAEFHSAFLGHVLHALGGVCGAVWSLTAEGAFHLEHRVNEAAVGLDRFADGLGCVAESLRHVIQGERPVWVPPGGGPKDGPLNPTAHALLLAPILIDNQPAGVVEVWLEPEREPDIRRSGARLLTELAGFAAAFLHRQQWRLVTEQRQTWARCEAFARRVHASLDPSQVAFVVANEGRTFTGCDQVSVALSRPLGHGLQTMPQLEVEAVSGVATVEARSPLVRAMSVLLNRVRDWGEVLVYSGTRDESLPPAVRQALDAYLRESPARALVALPLCDEREPRKGGHAVLLAECFENSLPADQLKGRLEVVAGHAGSALGNALAHQRGTAGWVARLRYRVGEWTAGRRSRKALLVLAVLLLVGGALALVPAPLRVEARGQLLPRERRIVYADLPGKVIDLKVRHGEVVQKGQELLFVQDLDTQLKVEHLAIKAAFAEQRLAVLNDLLGRAASEERAGLIKERIAQEYELRKAAVERGILMQGGAGPRKTPVPAPLAGKVVTFDAREQLVGKTVKPGDPLLRVACVEGPWEVELLLPENRLAAIREGLLRMRDGLEVELRLGSQPLRTYRGRLRVDGLGGEATLRDGAAVLPARVEIADPELAAQLANLPVGLEVRARVDCGPRAVGLVWFGDLIEFLYEHVLF